MANYCENLTALHPRSPFPERLAKHKEKIYLAGTGSNVGCWHTMDLPHLLEIGPFTAALPTFGAECRFITALQTLCRGAAKVGT